MPHPRTNGDLELSLFDFEVIQESLKAYIASLNDAARTHSGGTYRDRAQSLLDNFECAYSAVLVID